jgi:hypothetical protein
MAGSHGGSTKSWRKRQIGDNRHKRHAGSGVIPLPAVLHLTQGSNQVLGRASRDAGVTNVHTVDAAHYRQTVASIHAALQRGDQASFEAVAIVRGMIEAIEIKLGTNRMKLTVVSNLASFLHREQDGNLRTTLVVAGVGFEPTTFRL